MQVYVIKIKSFEIGQADCFLIRISDKDKYFNLMVDCGQVGMAESLCTDLGEQRLNGIVATHIDNDHIKGIVEFLEDPLTNDLFKNPFIIYNKYDESLISYATGRKLLEEISKRFSQKLLIKSYARNYNRENKIIERKRNKDNELPVKILSKNQRILLNKTAIDSDVVHITILSPDIYTLRSFMRKWSTLKTDSELINKSSVTFLLEYNGKSIVMLGDAITKDTLEEIKKINGIKKIDYTKLSHHGAEISNAGIEEFVTIYSCKKFGVTISKNQNGEKLHPNRKILTILKDRGCSIYTSTDYECVDMEDLIWYITKQSEIEL